MSSSHLNLGDTFGVLLIGVIISSCLYGVTCLQAWSYFRNYNDRLLIRIVVFCLIAFGTFHEVLCGHIVYYYLVVNFSDPTALRSFNWSSISIIPVTAVIAIILHAFYAVRIYQLSGKRDRVIPAILCTIKTVEVGLIIANAAKLDNKDALLEDFMQDRKTKTATLSAFALTVASDVMSTLAISYYLHSFRSGIRSTNTVINKLIVYTVNNGALSSVSSIVIMIFIALRPRALIWAAIYVIHGNLYCNSLLSTLNSRKSLMSSAHIVMDTMELGTFTAIDGNMTVISTMSPARPLEVVDDKPPLQVLGEAQ